MNDPTLEPQAEQVLIRIKRHWIVLLRGIFLLLFLWGICAFGLTIANGIREVFPLLSVILFLICLSLLIFAHHWLFLNFVGWELSIWVITDSRIISFTNIPYIENDVNSINISEIDQIEQARLGLVQNFLNYGTVIINIPANQQHIVFDYLPHPTKLANIVQAIQANRSFQSMTIKELEDFYRRKFRYLLEKWGIDPSENAVER